MTFEEECKLKGHKIGVCHACGQPYCLTEGVCLDENVGGDD